VIAFIWVANVPFKAKLPGSGLQAAMAMYTAGVLQAATPTHLLTASPAEDAVA